MHIKKIIIIASCVLILCVGIVGVALFTNNKEETTIESNIYQTKSYITEDIKENLQKCNVNLCL